MSVALEAANEQRLLAVLFPLGSAPYLGAFEPAQLHTLAYLSTVSYGYGFGVGLIFFGAECFILGYLLFTSGFFARALGVLMALAGACYLTNSFVLIVSPALASVLFPAILVPAFLGELSLCVWLITKGVDSKEWTRRAGDVRVHNLAGGT